MAFNRARRHLSNLASGSNNRKAKATEETRSTSGSTINSACSNDLRSTDENLAGRTRKHRQSITFDKLLRKDEIHEGLALAPKENSPSTSAVYSQATTGDFTGYQDRVASLDAGDKFPSLPQDRVPSCPAPTGASSEPLPSGTSSRRTTIWVGKPDIVTQRLQEGQANDEARLEAEQSYYECVDPAGQNRRRNMLRSVSKDDHLLARGANPRTGLVTPGVHSASDSYEEAELLKQRGIVLSPKWRQRGDQWVSLDIGEPTPLSSPPRGPRKHNAGRPLRTPPRLTAQKYNHVTGLRTSYQKPIVSAALPEDALTAEGLPGTFPITPQSNLIDSSLITRPGLGPVIKRKPVARASGTSERHFPPKLVIPEHSTDTVVKRPFETQTRSSSAPLPSVYNFETPDDVGKDSGKALPSVPNVQKHSNNHSSQRLEFHAPFLGHRRPREAEIAPASKLSAPFRQEKELPCLPMSNGQYPLRVSEHSTILMSHHTTTTQSEARRIMGPRGGDPAYPFVRNTRMIVPPRRYQINPNTSNGTRMRTPAMSIPTYDNPPSQRTMPPRPTRGMVVGPRPMHQLRSVSENIKKASNVFLGPPTIISTNTPISTHISTLQPKLQGRSHRMALGFEASHEQRLYQHSHDRFYPNDPRLRNRRMSINMPTAIPGARPRAESRPQMPDRADAHMRSVPRMNPQRSNQMGFTESLRPWRTNGTSEETCSARSDVGAASPTRSEIDRKIKPNLLWPPHIIQRTVDPASFRDDEDWSKSSAETRISGRVREDHSSRSSGLTKNCSRCQNGSVIGSLRSIAGQGLSLAPATVAESGEQIPNIEIQQQPLQHGAAVTGTTAALNSTNIEEAVDERDHTSCCTECCTVEDCHEGCLGHPSPSLRSFGGSTIVDTTSAPSSPDRDFPSVSPPTASIDSSQLKGKLSFVQGLRMRKTLRARQCPDDGKTIKERCNALESLPIELDSHPLSPGSFWGDGQGAVAAAKKAIGVRKCAATTPKATGESTTSSTDAKGVKRNTSPPRLAVPKIRDIRSCNASESSNSILPSRVPRSRNVSAAGNPSAVASASRSRNPSGASILSIEIPHIFSSLGTINVAVVLEMLRVPVEAAAMWIQTHPEFKQWLWNGVEKVMSMARTVVDTGGTVWEVSYVYSKTGKCRCKAPGGIGRLVVDCGRSVGYLLVFGALAVCVGRVLGFVLGLAQGLLWVFKAFGWLLKKLGLGFLW
jgi:hypothetical protein